MEKKLTEILLIIYNEYTVDVRIPITTCQYEYTFKPQVGTSPAPSVDVGAPRDQKLKREIINDNEDADTRLTKEDVQTWIEENIKAQEKANKTKENVTITLSEEIVNISSAKKVGSRLYLGDIMVIISELWKKTVDSENITKTFRRLPPIKENSINGETQPHYRYHVIQDTNTTFKSDAHKKNSARFKNYNGRYRYYYGLKFKCSVDEILNDLRARGYGNVNPTDCDTTETDCAPTELIIDIEDEGNNSTPIIENNNNEVQPHNEPIAKKQKKSFTQEDIDEAKKQRRFSIVVVNGKARIKAEKNVSIMDLVGNIDEKISTQKPKPKYFYDPNWKEVMKFRYQKYYDIHVCSFCCNPIQLDYNSYHGCHNIADSLCHLYKLTQKEVSDPANRAVGCAKCNGNSREGMGTMTWFEFLPKKGQPLLPLLVLFYEEWNGKDEHPRFGSIFNFAHNQMLLTKDMIDQVMNELDEYVSIEQQMGRQTHIEEHNSEMRRLGQREVKALHNIQKRTAQQKKLSDEMTKLSAEITKLSTEIDQHTTDLNQTKSLKANLTESMGKSFDLKSDIYYNFKKRIETLRFNTDTAIEEIIQEIPE